MVPFRQLCGIVLSAITNADVKCQVGTILQEAEKYTMSDAPILPTVQTQVDYDNIGGMPAPVPSMDGDGINGRTMDVDELVIPQSPTKYVNIGQYSAVRVDDDNTTQQQHMPDDLFDTPQLRKMRMTGKQHDPNRPNACTPEAIPIGSASGDDSEDDTHMSKAKIKANKKA